MSNPRVFLSYSHDSEAYRQRVLDLGYALRDHGIDVELDQFHESEIVDWPRWCNEGIQPDRSDYVLCLCSAEYRRRVEGKVPPEKGKGVYWEGSLLDDQLYDNKGNRRIISVLLDDEPEQSILSFLRGWTHCRLRQFVLTDPEFEQLIRLLTQQARVEKNPLGPIPVLPTQRAPKSEHSYRLEVDISRIAKYAPEQLIGREAELALLNDAWTKVQNHALDRPRILTFVALGGEGKTSLVSKWAVELAAQDWPGCEAVFAWSFYSQGTREQVAASSDLFLKEALVFFGDDADKAFAASAAGAYEKGQRLARIVGQRRSLLILDGLEPLQYAPTSPTPGELKDQGIAVLLKSLAANSQGLCLVTTRYSVPDLKAFWQTTAPEVKLLRLSREAGVHLLKTLGVRGTTEELDSLVEDVKGHALTLTLLGTFLKRAFHGDIRRRDCVKFDKADEKIEGGHAFRTIAAYEKWLLRDGGVEGRRELAVLRLMGLFDRPADAGCLAALRGEPIPGLTEPLDGLANEDWEFCLTGLEAAKLLIVNRDTASTLVSLDTHPHLRAYFAQTLKVEGSNVKTDDSASSFIHLDSTFCLAHKRLYEHLCRTTKEGKQPTLENLQPLYQAITHGCQAGLHQKTCHDVYYSRICRADERYVTRKLGAFGCDLGAVASFFEEPWNRVSTNLSESNQAWLINQAAFRLRALGRLAESLEPMRTGLKMRIKLKNWSEAAFSASNLSELELRLGNFAEAEWYAEQSMIYADLGNFLHPPIIARTTYAYLLHQSGRLAKAESRFSEAEVMQKKCDVAHPLLYSLRGFQYCDLLLTVSELTVWRVIYSTGFGRPKTGVITHKSSADHRPALKTVSRRAAKSLKWSQASNWLLDTALNHLALGRAELYEAVLSGSAFTKCHTSLENAVSGFRLAGAQEFIVNGLLTRALLRFVIGAYTGPKSAQEDLDEAVEIAKRGPMPLHMADILLTRARLFGVAAKVSSEPSAVSGEEKYPWGSPREDLEAAEKIILHETTYTRPDGTVITARYARRDQELADAKEALARVEQRTG